MKLNDAKVKSAKLPQGKKQLKLSDGGGLHLYINDTGKYGRLSYRYADKQKTLALGVYPSVGLKGARTKTGLAKNFWNKA
ncbi:Arm DNA-binding domain-containing protein [Ghiorsea bivora]|uniref:Arm DNA-binding domain-containing protein n=1 Tax=Ghiorsea bivora TaxID=1485545 RepID=UPI00068A1FFD|nr:Arm DNA-binding domain-containing protein [Ghiorsea bivora]